MLGAASRRRLLVAGVVFLVIGGSAAAMVRAGESDVRAALERLPVLTPERAGPAGVDWLVAPVARRAAVYRDVETGEVVMTNGLVRRAWRVTPNGATVALDNLSTGVSMLRGVKPEAIVELDGTAYDVGGLTGQPDYAYLLPEWLDTLEADPAAFRLVGLETRPTRAPFAWKRVRWSEDRPWPPPGVSLALRYAPPDGAGVDPGVTVTVHHELYDGLPLCAKWITVHNGGRAPVRLDRFTSELLAVVEAESHVEPTGQWRYPDLHAETDYAFAGLPGRGIEWVTDPQYGTQVNYRRQTPCLLVARPPLGPEAVIEPGGTFTSFRTFVLLHDATDRERQGLAVRRMYRTIAPWVTENPILMHVRSADPEAVRLAIDQCAEVGFEMVILTFGSGFDMENEDPAYLAGIRELVEYANARGVELGGYSLLASRRIGDEHDAINPATGKPGGMIFGNSPCLGSAWGIEYFRKLRAFFEATGMHLLEHDGNYPGDVCASGAHPGHRGEQDSQWTQWRTITDFYKWCRGRGVYLNVPDFYFLSGSNKTGMGYRETNWSLPRAQQIIHGRQNIYDGTWTKTPSMGWMFVPLVEYQGGGAAATLEPLAEHLVEYEAHLANNFGAGVQACYRGPRLYDTPETKAVVQRWVDFYRRHRAILDSDVIHVRRADGRDVDCLLHVSPELPTRGLAMVYNPRRERVRRTLTLPLYYTGLTRTARIREREGLPSRYELDRDHRVDVAIDLAPGDVTWFVIEADEGGSEDEGVETGWISLFNGRDLDGWTPKIKGHAPGVDPARTFRVEDGLLSVSYDGVAEFGGAFGHLFYRHPYSRYRLRVEYRFVGAQVPGGPGWALRNNGVMLHSQAPDTMRVDQEFPVSIEVQLLGGDGTNERPTANLCTPGTNVVMDGELVTRHCTSSRSRTFHGDGWVTVEIVVDGGERLVHRVDGETVLEYEAPQLDVRDADARALVKEGDLVLRGGYIALQAESHPTQFRRVEILPLEDPSPAGARRE